MRFLNITMEDNADGITHIEREYVMYATADKDLIRLATSWQEQEQYEFKQESAMVSDDYYFATPTGEAGSQTFTYVGANSGKTVTLA